MEHESQTPLKKSRRIPTDLFLWVVMVGVTFIILIVLALTLPGGPRVFGQWATALIVFAVASLIIGTFFLGLSYFVRWLCHWRNLRRFLFGVVCVATLIALFYAEEDWRGKHDWQKYVRQQAARGELLGWDSIVPPPVPDDQNFAFSPVWIAEDKVNFIKQPERAEAWYGKRIYDQDVARFVKLTPVYVSGIAHDYYWYHPKFSPPVVPDTPNLWPVSESTDLKPWQKYYRDMQSTNPEVNIPIASEPQSPAADVLFALSKYNPAIEQLRTDSVLPDSRFPIGYGDANKAAILLPHLAAVKRTCMLLQLRSIAEIQSGQTDQALADIKLSFRLVWSIHSEPFLISQLVRIAMVNLIMQPIWEGLATHQWSDAQLVELDHQLADLDFLADYGQAMRGETGLHDGFINYIRQHPEPLIDMWGNFNSSDMPYRYDSIGQVITDLALRFHLVPAGWFYQNELDNARYNEEFMVPVLDLNQRAFKPEQWAHAKATMQYERQHRTPFNFMEILFQAPLENAPEKFVRAQSYMDLARVAVALERYRLVHHAYPDSLNALSPQFMTEVPHDIMDGQPLRYRLEANGQFTLYSIGWNGKDDGGTITLRHESSPQPNFEEGDWVWRYPSR